MSERFVAKWYTRASRVRIVIAKFDGRWKLPGGPYPIRNWPRWSPVF